MQFPIGVFGVAIATAALPPLSRSTTNPDYVEFRQTLAHSLALVFLLCIPSAVGLAVLGRPIVALVFEHGKFTSFDTMQTANALAAYAIGLAGYAAVKVLSPAFYALNDARTPMLISLGSIAVNFRDEFAARRSVRSCRFGVLDVDRRPCKFSPAGALHAPPSRQTGRTATRQYGAARHGRIARDGGRGMARERISI